MNTQSNWTEFKEKFVDRNPELDPKLLDYIAVYDILRLGVNGLSNVEIADRLGLDVEYVIKTLWEFLGMEGYKESLEFSPLKQYLLYKNRPEQPVAVFSSMCEIYLQIERKIEEYYARN